MSFLYAPEANTPSDERQPGKREAPGLPMHGLRSVPALPREPRRAAPPRLPAGCSCIEPECRMLLSSSFSPAECRNTILTPIHSGAPSHLRRKLVTTVLIVPK